MISAHLGYNLLLAEATTRCMVPAVCGEVW